MCAEAICRLRRVSARVTTCRKPGRSRPLTSITVKVSDALLSISTRGSTVKTRSRLGHEAALAVELALDVEAVGQRQLDAGGEPRQTLRPVERLALEVLDPERVERHAVGQREDLGVDDVGAADRHGAGQAGEQAVRVERVDRDLGDRALRRRCDARWRAAAGRARRWRTSSACRASVARIERQPVGRVAAGEMLVLLGVGPARQQSWRPRPGSA